MISRITAVMGIAGLVVGALAWAAPAVAEVGDSSNATGQFLSGTLLTGNLASIAGINGAQATYVDGTTAGSSNVQTATLDVTALNTVNVDLGGGVSVPLGNLLHLGAVNQYAQASPDGVSRAASGAVSNDGAVDLSGNGGFPADATVDLTQLLGPTPALSAANLTLGAVTGVAALDAGALQDGTPLATSCTDLSNPVHCRDYNIAGAHLNLTSPLVGNISTAANGALTTLSTGVNGLSNQIVAGLLSGVTNSLGSIQALLPGASVVSNTLAVNLDTSQLATALNPVLSQTLSAGGVSIDLQTGAISVDLAQFVNLNNLPPNSSLLTPAVLQAIANQVDTLLGNGPNGLQTQINNALTAAVNSVGVTVTGGVCLLQVISCTAGINVGYTGTLGGLLSGNPALTVTGTGAASVLSPIVNTLAGTIQTTMANAVQPLVTNLVSTAGNTVDQAVTNLTNGLDPVLTGLGNVVAVDLNVQQNNVDGAGTFTEVAARVSLLNAGGATIDLGKAVVGPNVDVDYTPTLTATSPAQVGGSTTVGGDGWPPNTQVSLQLTDSAGAPVGNPVTVTTDGSGGIPSGTTVPIPNSATPGSYTVVGTTAAGTTASAPVTVVNGTPPAAPVITSPADGSSTNDTTPPIKGTGAPGDTVNVTIDGTVVGTTTVQPDGTWTFTPTTPLAQGPHTVTATQTDAAGNTSAASTPVTFTVDTTAPAAPVITAPTNGSITNDNTPPITGTGEPGDTVNVTIDGTVVGTTTVQPDGTWTFTPTTPLADGSHTVSATQTDVAGNTSPASTPVTFTVDTTAPAAPVITAPANGSTTTDNTPPITGTGEPGATVSVTVDGTNIGTALVQPDGSWTLTPAIPLSNGPHTVTATQTDSAGNTSPASTPVTFTVAAPVVAPVITSPADGSTTTDTTPPIKGTGTPGDTVNVTIDGTVVGTTTVQPDGTWTFTPTTPLANGSHTVSATQTDAAGTTGPASNSVAYTVIPAAPVITSPAGGSSTNDSTPPIKGTGVPGDTVTVTIDGTVVGTTTVQPDGTWTLTPTTPLADGSHTVSATQTDAAGNTSPASTPVTFTVDTVAPAAPVITSPTDGSTTKNPTPPIKGTGVPGDTVTVTIDGTVVGTTTVQPDGTWTFTPTTPLADGSHTVSATQTDAAGNTSPVSNSVTFTVAAPVVPPVITSPTNGGSTSNKTPVVSGTGTPGSTVTVSVNGHPAATAKVGRNGHWSVGLPSPLSCGPHTLTATQSVVPARVAALVARSGAAGVAAAVRSAKSAPVTFTVTCAAAPPAGGTGPGGPTAPVVSTVPPSSVSSTTLPNTGAPAWTTPLTLAGIGSLLVGLVLVTRRRRP